MKKIGYICLLIALSAGLMGCSSNQDNSNDNKDDASGLTTVKLDDYPQVKENQTLLINDFNDLNGSVTPKLEVTLQHVQKSTSGENKGNIIVTYTADAADIVFFFTEKGELQTMAIQSNDNTKNEAYLAAVTSSMFMREFEFTEENRKQIQQMIEQDQLSGTFTKYSVGNIVKDDAKIFSILKN